MATALRYGKSMVLRTCFRSALSNRLGICPVVPASSRRTFKTESSQRGAHKPDFAFAFDIDGVLIRSSKPLPRAQKALRYLQSHNIPFILLTNGGGKHETDRVSELSDRLGVPLDTSLFIQSHTPFAELVDGNDCQEALKDKCILVMGGDGDMCRKVAEKYGFKNVLSPGDIYAADPTIWPFSRNFMSYYASHAHPLPKPVVDHLSPDFSQALKIDAIFIYNDPRDWALDTQLILDLLLSHKGYLGTISSLNGDPSLPNRGYQQDGQPPLYFSNQDLLWAAAYHLPRLGQGGFRAALEGVWRAITGGEGKGVELQKRVFGKPHTATYAFAEKRLEEHRPKIMGRFGAESKLRSVYMVGDNPESDIKGANDYKSPQGTDWKSILVRSGVYNGGEPAWKPKVIVDDVWDAVQWGLKSSGWKPPD
ncbi:Haloacid dehalogenase-like hydrolase domain-containing 5 [Trapelia coarctata]|nr:Haloacid dehalogenase-like hydrolase domain-containing 5 [Trapelia coarctata]